jgi:hypothetical protein
VKSSVEAEDVKPALFSFSFFYIKKRISTSNHFEEEDFYPDELWNRHNHPV